MLVAKPGQQAVTISDNDRQEILALGEAVIPVLTQHYAMLQRNLLYTGITRGRRLVVLVGQRKAIAIAVRNVSGRRRWSKLKEWLSPCINGESESSSLLFRSKNLSPSAAEESCWQDRQHR
jgi:UvrD-like helicase C-terminal domain